MFESLCSLPLTSDVFAQALHPTTSVVAVGLTSGHVESFRLPRYPAAADEDEDEDGYGDRERDGLMTRTGAIETQWRTRRHKGSCRTLCYSHDGEDGLIKAASPTTGQVHSKVRIPSPTATPDAPTLLHALSPQSLLLATDSGLLHLYDLRLPTTTTANLLPSKPSQSHQPHDDYVSSLTPLPPTVNSTSGFSKQWISTGATTLAVTDLRRGVLAKSVDQEEELLSSVSVDGFPRLVVGSTNGVLSLWEKGAWDDQIERIRVCQKGGTQSLDVLVAVPANVRTGPNVAVGVGDGSVAVVKLGENRVMETLKHDEVEGVIGLGFDVEGRLVSGGGSVIKIWLDDSNLDDMCVFDSDSKVDTKCTDSEDSDSDKSLGSNNSDHANRGRKARRKRRKHKAAPQMGNGIMKFKGLE